MPLHHLPTDREVRNRILAVKDEKYRYAFMYQYIVAGRISEVCGDYAPRGTDAFKVNYVSQGETYPAALFVVKTAKRRGRLRPCAVPFDPIYEPWSQPLFDYFKKAGEDYPFRFHENWETSKTYGMKQATKALKGLEWPMIEYTQQIETDVSPENILDESVNETNREIYKVLLEDGTTKWFTKIGKNKVMMSKKILGRWKEATSHIFRKRKTRTLVFDYYFDEIDLALYGGWTEATQAESMPAAIKHYLYVDIQSAVENVKLLKRLANRYFHKLLLPYDELTDFEVI